MRRRHINTFVSLSAIIVVIIGMVCIAGYVLEQESFYKWPNSYPMAFPTGCCLIAIGLNQFIISRMLCRRCFIFEG